MLVIVPPILAERPHYIYDNANVVSSSMISMINEFGRSADKATTAEIVIVTLKTLPVGKSVEQTKLDYFNTILLDGVAGIGKSVKDNGVLILIVMDSHDWAIEVGYGLEGQLTDAECGRIGRDIMTPYFKDNKYGDGLFRGMQAIATEIGYVTSITYTDTGTGTTTFGGISWDTWFGALDLIIVLIAVVVMLIIILMVIRTGGRGWSGGSSGRSYGGGGGGSFGGGGSGGGGGGGKWNIPSVIPFPIGMSNFFSSNESLLSRISEGSHYCPVCKKDTEYSKNSETSVEKLVEGEGRVSQNIGYYLCLICGSIYTVMLPSILLESMIDYKYRVLQEKKKQEEEEEERRARRNREEEERRHRDSDSTRSTYHPSSSGSFGGGSSGGGGARGKW